jgi:hypothetical protein
MPASISSVSGERITPILTDRARDFITTRLARRDPPERIAAALRALFEIKIDSDQVVACWSAHNAPATQTGPRPENESMQIPAEAVEDSIIQRTAPGAPPILTDEQTAEAAPARSRTRRSSPARTTVPRRQPRPEKESVQILTGEVREFIIGRMARLEPPWLIAKAVQEKFSVRVDSQQILVCWRDRDALPTQTGPRQEKESMPILNDEIKEFIVKRIACYETPTRIAAAVKNNFGVAVDRRQIFEYNPAGSRPPAQRWIDLHTATRARFLRETAEIAVAQKAVRLRMLDRFAQTAEESNRDERAAKFLEQAARECGGFYEKGRAPHAAEQMPPSVAPAHPETGSSRISTVPPAS